jgi:hypothetical protein
MACLFYKENCFDATIYPLELGWGYIWRNMNAAYLGFSSSLLLWLYTKVELAKLLDSWGHNLVWLGSQEMTWRSWTPLELVVTGLQDPPSLDVLLITVASLCTNSGALVTRSGQKLCIRITSKSKRLSFHSVVAEDMASALGKIAHIAFKTSISLVCKATF